jgi:hypothetical protein
MRSEKKARGGYDKGEKTVTFEDYIRELEKRRSGSKNRMIEDQDTFTDAEEQRAALSPTTLFFLSR